MKCSCHSFLVTVSFLFDGNFALDRTVNTLYNGKADGV